MELCVCGGRKYVRRRVKRARRRVVFDVDFDVNKY